MRDEHTTERHLGGRVDDTLHALYNMPQDLFLQSHLYSMNRIYKQLKRLGKQPDKGK